MRCIRLRRESILDFPQELASLGGHFRPTCSVHGNSNSGVSQMEKVPLLFMGPLANVELLIAFVVLDWFFGRDSWRRGTP